MTNPIADWAAWYLQTMRWSVVPLLPDKRPLIQWHRYQKEFATLEDIAGWWAKYPDSMIGIVTGRISNLAVIDIDTEEGRKLLAEVLPEDFNTPIAHTPNGMHLYCRYNEGLSNRVRMLQGVDLRAEGGYVVAPPSINEELKNYRWDDVWKVPEKEILNFPQPLLDAITAQGPGYQPNEQPGEILQEGRRDDDLFRAANLMAKGGGSQDEIRQFVSALAQTANPPFPQKEADRKVESALQRTSKRESTLKEDFMAWLSITQGWASIGAACRAMNIFDTKDRANLRVIIHRASEEGIVEKHPDRDGLFRRVEQGYEEMDVSGPVEPGLDIKLPLGLMDLANIYSGNIILIAGEKDSGKTTFMLNVVQLNQAAWDIWYQNSEMGSNELKLRMSLFGNVEWKFHPIERSSDFSALIQPDAINIIDFMVVHDTFYIVAKWLDDIKNKLDKGIAVVALQKDRFKELGRGGSFSLELPRLYVTMRKGGAKIVSAKNWKDSDRNPNDLVTEFKLIQGQKFIQQGDWHEDFDEKDKSNKWS